MARSIQNQVSRGLAWVSLAAAVVAVCDLVSLALILRFWLSKAEYGVVSVVLTTFGALQLVVEGGLPTAIVQRDVDDDARLASAYWFNLGSGFVLYGLIWVVSPWFARAHGDPMITDLFRAAGAILVVRPLYSTHQALLRKKLRFGELSKVRVVANLFELAVKVGTAAAGVGPWCYVFGTAVRELTYAIGVPLIAGWRPRFVFAFAKIRDDFRFGLRSTGAELIYQIYSNADYQVVGLVFGNAAVGVYRAAYELVLEPVRFLSGIVTTIAMPTFARLRGDRSAVIEQLVAFTRQNLAVVLMFVAVILVGAEDILALVYGEDYLVAATAARVLAIVGVLRALSHLGPPLLDGLGHPGMSLRYQLTAATVLVVGFVIAGKVGSDFNAVAYAWAIGYPIAFAVLVRMMLDKVQLGALAYLARVGRLVGLIAGSCAVGLGVRFATAGWDRLPRLIASGSTVLVLAAVALALLEGFTPRQIAQRIRG